MNFSVWLKSMDLKVRLLQFAFVGASIFALSACTTIEGTNAFSDGETFEREVMSETLKGIGLLPRESKEDVKNQRADLVLPKSSDVLPIPTKSSAIAQLPEDSDKVLLDASKLTPAEIQLLRGARVVDLKNLSTNGRAFTPAEMAEVSRRFREQREKYAAEKNKGANRPLYLPPERYFTKVGGTELICLTDDGDLVPLDSPLCPEEIRAALQGQ